MLSRLYRGVFFIVLLLIWFGFFNATDTESKVTQSIMAGAILPVLMWLDTLFILGFSIFKPITFMSQVFTRSSRSPILVGMYLLILFSFYPPFATNNLPNNAVPFSIFSITLVLLYLQPPFVFVLGESATHTGRVLNTLSNDLFPLRTVAMLDRKRTKSDYSTFSWLTDDLRVHSERDWRDVADGLLDVSKLIVLDARTNSPIVTYEVSNILSQPTILSKTFFIVDTNGNATALEKNGYKNPRSDIHVILESEIGKLKNRDFLSQTLSGWKY